MATMNFVFQGTDNLIDFLAGRMQDHTDIADVYPNATIEDLKNIFDFQSAIQLNPEAFPVEQVSTPDFAGLEYSLNAKSVAKTLELCWDYENVYAGV